MRTTHSKTPYFLEYADQSDDETTEETVEVTDEVEVADAEDEQEIVIPEDLSEIDDEALVGLHSQAVEAFNALWNGGKVASEAMEALSVLTEGIERVTAEMGTREEAASKRAEDAAALAARAGIDLAAQSETDESGDDEAVADETVEVETAEVADEAAEVEALAASGAKSKDIRINLSGLRSRSAPAPAPEVVETAATGEFNTMRDIVKAAPEFAGFKPGQGLDWSDLGQGLDRRLALFNRSQYEQANARGQHIRSQQALAVIQKPFDPAMVLTSTDPVHIDQMLQRAADESRLPQNSLVASGGWCAPSETIYDLCEIETRDGLFSLPEIGITRGGIKFTPGPNFADIYANTGFHYTEQEDIDGDYDGAGGGSKPCYTVECPDFDEERLDYDGLCINAGLLMQRGFPEVIARTIRGALVAHDHRISAGVLAAIEAGSTAVTMTAAQVGTTAPVLDAIEMQVEHYRTVNRASRSASLEAVFPFWVRGAIRSDLARRLGVDLLSVSDDRIAGWFRDRGIAPQFVYNFNDLTGTAANMKVWPNSVKFLLYGAGTWVKGGADIITIDTLYDSVLLGTNDYTALFTEEGWLVAKMCHDSRVVTVPVCSTGETGGGLNLNCDGTMAPAV